MLAVRWLHVLGMAVALGGAALSWALVRRVDSASALTVAETYENAFWVAVGVLVMTGVGNLGDLAPFVPGPETAWGGVFVAKLLVVVSFLAASAVRTLAVGRLRESAVPVRTALARAYAATTVALVALVALAEVLAHG